MKISRGNRPGLYEQMLIWMGACLAVGLVIANLPSTGSAEFQLVPDSVLRISTALGLVMLSYGLFTVGKAVLNRAPYINTGAFVTPLIGLAIWAAPVLVEVAFH